MRGTARTVQAGIGSATRSDTAAMSLTRMVSAALTGNAADPDKVGSHGPSCLSARFPDRYSSPV